MLIELDNSELLHMLEVRDLLRAKVEAAYSVLVLHARSATGATAASAASWAAGPSGPRGGGGEDVGAPRGRLNANASGSIFHPYCLLSR